MKIVADAHPTGYPVLKHEYYKLFLFWFLRYRNDREIEEMATHLDEHQSIYLIKKM